MNLTKIIQLLTDISMYLLFYVGFGSIFMIIIFPLLLIGVLPIICAWCIKMWLITTICSLLLIFIIEIVKSFLHKKLNNANNL